MTHGLPAASEVLEGAVFGLLALASLHSVHRVWLLGALWRLRSRPTLAPAAGPPGGAPVVTVQIPLFNERDVADRVIAACASLDWPHDRLELQVLDDSTDDTGPVVDEAVARARAKGVNVSVLRRQAREGFKAGALAAGLAQARGELVAIFDADFVPEPDFLRRLVPRFSDPRLGMVQARWGHINAAESALTQAQATLLDGHFNVDHAARAGLGCWFNFNGTAGVWRRSCIEEAGGWQGDTLTEDLDLSYRAQLADWRFAYAAEVVVPAELPSTMAAFRAQQRRWALGSIQTLRKLAGRVLRSPAPVSVRAEALAHLGANLGWLPAVGLMVLLPWAVALRASPASGWLAGASLGLCTLPSLVFYAVASGGWRGVPAAAILALGLAPSQARATLDGLRGTREAFARTPKRGASGRSSYVSAGGALRWLELALALTHLGAVAVCVARGEWRPIPFLSLFALGLLWAGSGWRGAPVGARPASVGGAMAAASRLS